MVILLAWSLTWASILHAYLFIDQLTNSGRDLITLDSSTPSLIMGRFFPARLILNQVVAVLPIAFGSWFYYVVECAGKLLLVSWSHVLLTIIELLKIFIPLDGTLHHTVSFKLYELDLKERSLIEIKSVGDYTLFVGFNNAIRLRFQRKPKPIRGIACTFLMITMMQYLEWLKLKGD